MSDAALPLRGYVDPQGRLRLDARSRLRFHHQLGAFKDCDVLIFMFSKTRYEQERQKKDAQMAQHVALKS